MVFHNGSLDDGRVTCIFSRVIHVIPGQEGVDLNLDKSYYVMIGTGEDPGVCLCRLSVRVCACMCICIHTCVCVCDMRGYACQSVFYQHRYWY